MKIWKYIFFSLVILSCHDTTENVVESLETYIANNTFETGAVIACAASEANTNNISTFFYPEPGASNVKFFETEHLDLAHEDYTNYKEVFIASEPFFNGHLRRFTQASENEKWVIITFELDGDIKISNPIRIKHLSKPTVWTENVSINQDGSRMPVFTWEDNAAGDNAIYFQVVSDAQNNLLSGTYTFENTFQYYNLSNVVLNVTTEPPPNLIGNTTYNFTLMDVSLDNWVNLLITKSFKVE